MNPDGPVGDQLKIDNQYSEWSIYQGVGRAVRNESQLRVIFDELIKRWEDKGGAGNRTSFYSRRFHIRWHGGLRCGGF